MELNYLFSIFKQKKMRPISVQRGIKIYDRLNSHIHGDILSLIREALPAVNFNSDFIKIQHVFDRVIGVSHCVRCMPNDKYYMKRRGKRQGLTRFVSGREPEPSRSLVVILKKMTSEKNSYVIITAYIGEPAPREPWDAAQYSEDELRDSLAFWSEHVLIEE